jgi:AI-2 transport protein TqsA
MKPHPLQTGAYLVIIAAGMKFAAPILNNILLALLLAISIMPIIIWLMKKGVPKALALTITILSLILLTIFIASVLSVAVVGIADKLPQYKGQLISLKDNLATLLSQTGINLSDLLSLQDLDPDKIINLASDFISGIVNTFSNFTLIFLLIIFILIDLADLRYKIYRKDRKISHIEEKTLELADAIRKYVSISAFTGLLTAVGNLVLLLILGVDFPVLWAFLSFLFSFIPNFGFILSVIPPVFIALGDSGTTTAVIVVIGFIIINGIVENVIKPKYMGGELDMSLTMIFISLIVWTWILGAMGAILAIPMTMSFLKAWEILFAREAT